jgi:hypothetical protein
MTIITPSSIVEAHSKVVGALLNKLPDQQHKFFSNIKAFIES